MLGITVIVIQQLGCYSLFYYISSSLLTSFLCLSVYLFVCWFFVCLFTYLLIKLKLSEIVYIDVYNPYTHSSFILASFNLSSLLSSSLSPSLSLKHAIYFTNFFTLSLTVYVFFLSPSLSLCIYVRVCLFKRMTEREREGGSV